MDRGCTGSVSTRAIQILSVGNIWQPPITGLEEGAEVSLGSGAFAVADSGLEVALGIAGVMGIAEGGCGVGDGDCKMLQDVSRMAIRKVKGGFIVFIF